MLNRCTGHCCKDFTLPISPCRIEHIKRRSKYYSEDIRKVAEMVIFIRWDYQTSGNKAGSKKEFQNYGHNWDRADAKLYHYTCKYLKDGNCTNYEQRPDMCRNYPYGRKCEYRGCTLTDLGVCNENMTIGEAHLREKADYAEIEAQEKK